MGTVIIRYISPLWYYFARFERLRDIKKIAGALRARQIPEKALRSNFLTNAAGSIVVTAAIPVLHYWEASAHIMRTGSGKAFIVITVWLWICTAVAFHLWRDEKQLQDHIRQSRKAKDYVFA